MKKLIALMIASTFGLTSVASWAAPQNPAEPTPAPAQIQPSGTHAPAMHRASERPSAKGMHQGKHSAKSKAKKRAQGKQRFAPKPAQPAPDARH